MTADLENGVSDTPESVAETVREGLVGLAGAPIEDATYLGPRLVAGLRGDEGAADEQREGQHAARIGIVLVRAELPEQSAQKSHAADVDPVQSPCHVAIAA